MIRCNPSAKFLNIKFLELLGYAFLFSFIGRDLEAGFEDPYKVRCKLILLLYLIQLAKDLIWMKVLKILKVPL